MRDAKEFGPGGAAPEHISGRYRQKRYCPADHAHQAGLDPEDMLRQAGIPKTRQRLTLIPLLFNGQDRPVTAEQIHAEAMARGHRLSMPTVYNTLRQFKKSGLLCEVADS